MKRAWLILIAVLAIVLAYPATLPSAKSPANGTDTPTIVLPPLGDGPDGSGESDDGDADDPSGNKIRGKDRPTGSSVLESNRLGASVWWMYFFYFRVL